MQGLRITADGSIKGTKIVTPNGEDISASVRSVTFTHQAGEIPTVTLVAFLEEVDVTGLGDEYRRFVKADG